MTSSLAAPEFDLVLAVVGSSARHYPQAHGAPDHRSADASKPLAAFLVPEAPEALAALRAAGVPNFRTPEACADAIAAVLGRRPPLPLPAGRLGRAFCETQRLQAAPVHVGSREGSDPTRAYTARHKSSGLILDEHASFGLLDRLGIARAPSVALDAEIAQPARAAVLLPGGAKVLSAEIAHKSDVGRRRARYSAMPRSVERNQRMPFEHCRSD